MNEQVKIYPMDNYENTGVRPGNLRGNRMSDRQKGLIDEAWKLVTSKEDVEGVLESLPADLREHAKRSFGMRLIWMEQRNIKTNIKKQVEITINRELESRDTSSLNSIAWAVRRLKKNTAEDSEQVDTNINWDKTAAIAVLGMLNNEGLAGKKVSELTQKIEGYRTYTSQLSDDDSNRLEELRQRYISPVIHNVETVKEPKKVEKKNKKFIRALGLAAVVIAGGLLLSNSGVVGPDTQNATSKPESVPAGLTADMVFPKATEPPVRPQGKNEVQSTDPARIFGARQETPVPPRISAEKPRTKSTEINQAGWWDWLKLKAGGQEIDLANNFSLEISEEAAKAAGKKTAIKVAGEISVNRAHDPLSEEYTTWTRPFDNWISQGDLIGVEQGNNGRAILRPHAGDLWIHEFQGDWVRTAGGEIDPETGQPKIIGQLIPIEQDGKIINARVRSLIVVSKEAYQRTQRWFETEEGRPMMWDLGALTNKDNILWDGKTGQPDDSAIDPRIMKAAGVDVTVCGKPGYANSSNLDNYFTIMSLTVDATPLPQPAKIAGEPGGGMSRPEISFRVGTRQESKESVEDFDFEMSEVVDQEIIRQVEAEMGSDPKVWMIDKLKEFSDQWIDEYQAALKQAAENGTQPEARSFSEDVKNSDWFKDVMRDKTPEEMEFIEANLRNIDYTMEKKPGVVIQCQPYDTLVEAMVRGDRNMHFMGVAGIYPKDLIPDKLKNVNQQTTETVYSERFGNWVTAGKVNIDMVKAGDSIVNPVMGDTIEDEQGNKLVTGHIWKIVKVIETAGGPVLLVTSANSDKDGRIINEIVASQAEFDRLFGAEAAIISPSK